MASLPSQVKPLPKLPRPFPVIYPGDKFPDSVRQAGVNFVCELLNDQGYVIELRDEALDKGFAFGIEMRDKVTLWVMRDITQKSPLRKADYRWIRKTMTHEIRDCLAHAYRRKKGVFQRFLFVDTLGGSLSFSTDYDVKPISWEELFGNIEMPSPMNRHRFVELTDNTVTIQHYLEGGGNTEMHTYHIALNSISTSLLSSIKLHRTYPRIVPHSHRITYDGNEIYNRKLYVQHAELIEQPDPEQQSDARWFQCQNCYKPFVSFISTDNCAACDGV
jgi:hypothetical protein